MKVLTIVMKVLLILVLITPILGASGVFPAPTADLYSPSGWAFMEALMNSGYMFPLLALTAAVVIVLLIMNRTALAAIILAPYTVNVLCFHLFVDGTFFHPAASLGWVLILGNAYFLWLNRKKYKALW